MLTAKWIVNEHGRLVMVWRVAEIVKMQRTKLNGVQSNVALEQKAS